MCGIIGYIGFQNATPILLQGLRRLEYRGYDSSGIAIHTGHTLLRERAVGKIDALSNHIANLSLLGTMGIAHTRWSTHGGVTENNAHPHADCSGKIMLCHNGIIENYRELKEQLKNHIFTSETDSEVLCHLIESMYQGDLHKAVIEALSKIRGTYGITVMHADEPGRLIVARLGSPIVIGLGEKEFFVASDPTPMLAYTHNVMYLDDEEIADITCEEVKTFNITDDPVYKVISTIEWDEKQAQKSGFDHFMQKEIMEQPMVLMDAIRGRISFEEGTARLGGCNMTSEQMRSISRVIFVACGTAYHTGMIGKCLFEQLAQIPTEIAIASEFRYSAPILNNKTLVIALSQSGETADTLAAVKEAKSRGAHVLGIINVIGSTIAREVRAGTYIHAGPELAVASTKAYINTIAVLVLYAVKFGRLRSLWLAQGQEILSNLIGIPSKIEEILSRRDEVKMIAQHYALFEHFLFLGRGINYPVALEGSLKLKEISYIHSQAYAAGEMKHGTNALLAPELPVLAIMTKNRLYEKMRSSVEEVKARHSPVILVCTEGDTDAEELSEHIMRVPATLEVLEPLLTTIPLQLFAYYCAVARSKDVDRPRNLAKSVTVE